MATVSLSLDEIYKLANKTLLANGCDQETADILSELITNAERDGSLSHGLFRLPAYISGLKSGKINGKQKPDIKKLTPSVIKADGKNCLAPVVLNKSIPELVKAAKENGVAVLAIINSHHMAAMWPETEKIADEGLVHLHAHRINPQLLLQGLLNHYLAQTQFLSLGQEKIIHQLFMIWPQLQWLWEKCKLQSERDTKFH